MLKRRSRLVLAFAVLTAGSGVGLADDHAQAQRTPRSTMSCWSSWAAWIPPRIPCSRTTARGSNICRRPISARWRKPGNPTVIAARPATPPRHRRSRARPERNKMNNKQRALLLALLLAAATPVFAQEPPRLRRQPRATPSAPPATACLGRVCRRPAEAALALRKPVEHPAARAAAGAGARQPALAGHVAGAAWPGARSVSTVGKSLPPDQRRPCASAGRSSSRCRPNEQAAVRQNFHRFQQLPPERRKSYASAGATPARRSVSR